MGGGGSQSQTSTAPPQWLQDNGQGYLDMARQVAQMPFENYNGQRVANLSPMTRSGMQGVADLAGGSPGMSAANGMLLQTLNGGGMNPYQDGVINRAMNAANRNFQDQTGAITARFNRPGNFAGSAHESAQSHANEDFARGSTDAAANVLQSGYENERNRQMQAVGATQGLYGAQLGAYNQSAQLGDLDRQNQQSLIDSQYGDWQRWNQHPQQQLDTFGNALGRITGTQGQTQTTNGPGADRISQGMGTIMLGNMLRGSGSGK